MQVRLPNGKRASAITLGGSEISDAAMLQILGDEEWPFVPIANKGESQIGDWCFGLGHPGGFDKERGVVVRIGKIIAKKTRLCRQTAVFLERFRGRYLILRVD